MPYDDVLAHLVDSGIRFVVTGGYAVRFHGYERPIADLDLVVDRTPQAAASVMQSLMALGFYPTIPLSLSEVVVLTFMDTHARRVDVNARYLVPFEELVERAARHSVLERTIAVIALHDLITVKRRRGRQYDLEDVAQLERVPGPGGRD